jgi:hypothetical protein
MPSIVVRGIVTDGPRRRNAPSAAAGRAGEFDPDAASSGASADRLGRLALRPRRSKTPCVHRPRLRTGGALPLKECAARADN